MRRENGLIDKPSSMRTNESTLVTIFLSSVFLSVAFENGEDKKIEDRKMQTEHQLKRSDA